MSEQARGALRLPEALATAYERQLWEGPQGAWLELPEPDREWLLGAVAEALADAVAGAALHVHAPLAHPLGAILAEAFPELAVRPLPLPEGVEAVELPLPAHLAPVTPIAPAATAPSAPVEPPEPAFAFLANQSPERVAIALESLELQDVGLVLSMTTPGYMDHVYRCLPQGMMQRVAAYFQNAPAMDPMRQAAALATLSFQLGTPMPSGMDRPWRDSPPGDAPRPRVDEAQAKALTAVQALQADVAAGLARRDRARWTLLGVDWTTLDGVQLPARELPWGVVGGFFRHGAFLIPDARLLEAWCGHQAPEPARDLGLVRQKLDGVLDGFKAVWRTVGDVGDAPLLLLAQAPTLEELERGQLGLQPGSPMLVARLRYEDGERSGGLLIALPAPVAALASMVAVEPVRGGLSDRMASTWALNERLAGLLPDLPPDLASDVRGFIAQADEERAAVEAGLIVPEVAFLYREGAIARLARTPSLEALFRLSPMRFSEPAGPGWLQVAYDPTLGAPAAGIGGPGRVVLSATLAAAERGLGVPLAHPEEHADRDVAPGSYEIRVRERVRGRGTLLPEWHLVPALPGDEDLGIAATDPLTGRPATWVCTARAYRLSPERKPRAASEVYAEHVALVARRHAADLLTLDAASDLLLRLTRFAPAASAHLNQRLMGTTFQEVVRALLSDGISLRDQRGLMEGLAIAVDLAWGDGDRIAEKVRASLAHTICEDLLGTAQELTLIGMTPELTSWLASHLGFGATATAGVATPELRGLMDTLEDHAKALERPVVLAMPELRLPFSRLAARLPSRPAVIAPAELPREFPAKIVAMLEAPGP